MRTTYVPVLYTRPFLPPQALLESSTGIRPGGHPQFLDPSGPDIVHPRVDGDMFTCRPRLLDRVSGTDMLKLTFHVLLHDNVDGCVVGRVGEVERGDEGSEWGEPATEGGFGGLTWTRGGAEGKADGVGGV